VLLDALALTGLALEVELELELEHPAVPSRPAARTAAPSQAAVRRLKMSTKLVVRDPSDTKHSGAKWAD
jgi:hypothetical protein